MTSIEYDKHHNKFYYKESGADLLNRIQKLVNRYNNEVDEFYFLNLKIQRRRFLFGNR
jgi:hypothetical protein